MAQFYRVKTAGKPDTLYDFKTNQKIINQQALQSGGYNQEVATPTVKAGSVAIPNSGAIPNYSVTNQIGGTLYGTLKTPTSNDIATGLNSGNITPPQNTADLLHATFANNANQYSQSQKDMIAVREQQLTDTQKQMTDVNKQIADNQAKIDQNKTDVNAAYTGSMDDPNLQGWRQQAVGYTSADLQAKYKDSKAEYDLSKSMSDELGQLSSMYANELAKPQPLAIASVATGRLNNTREQYAGRISFLQAGIAAYDHNISLANIFIDRGIEAVNADRQDRLKYLNFVQDLATSKDSELKTQLLNLSKDEKTALDNEIAIIQDQIKQTEDNRDFITKLLTDTQTAQTAIKAGVSITDTQDEATQKIVNYTKANPYANSELLSPTEAATLGVPYGTTVGQAAAKGITPARWKGTAGTNGGGATPIIPSITDENGNIIIDSTSQSILAQTGLSLPAFAYMTQGTAALTRMTAAQRLQYMNEAQNYLNKTGTDVSTFQSQYAALSKTVEANVLRNNQAAVAESELEATISNLRNAASEAGLDSLTGLNVAKIWTGKQLNKPEASTYKFHLEQIRNEFAMYNAAISGQIDANGNIRQINEADLKKADEIIQNGFAAGSIDGFEKGLRASMSKMGVVLQNSVGAQNKQVWKLFGVGEHYQNQASEVINSQPAPPSQAVDYIKSLNLPEPKPEGVLSKIGNYIKNLFN
jgi:hypothetical protein